MPVPLMVHLSPSQTVKRKALQAVASETRAKTFWERRMLYQLQKNVRREFFGTSGVICLGKDEISRRDCVVKVDDGPNLVGRQSTFLSDAPARTIGTADLAAPLISPRYLLSNRMTGARCLSAPPYHASYVAAVFAFLHASCPRVFFRLDLSLAFRWTYPLGSLL